MSTFRNYFILILSVVLAVVICRPIVHALTVTTSSNVFITAQVCDPVAGCGTTGGGTGGTGGTGTGGSGGSGGSSSGTGTTTTGTPTTVNFSGMGYPSSKVVILQDGVQVITSTADPNANFSASLTNLQSGSYTFSLYTTDTEGRHSVSFSFPVYVTAGATVNIGGIILAPTIDVDKSQVRHGENEAIFGFAVPNSQVNIAVHSDSEHLVNTKATSTGAYLYNFDTTPLEYGSHNAQSHSLVEDKVSATTSPVSFIVGDTDITKTKSDNSCGTIIGDVNCDGKVNLVDFSILAYWYKKGTTPPANVDLNGDGKITLVDFSIMAYHWTG